MQRTAIWFGLVFVAGTVVPVRAQSCELELVAPPPGSGYSFGTVVDLEGDRLLVTEPLNNSVTGVAYVFERSPAGWIQKAKLAPAELDSGDAFGRSGALSGDTVLIGVQQDSVVGPVSGSAYVFIEVAGVWVEQTMLVPDDAEQLDQFGTGVALEGDTALIGAPGAPAVYVFERTGSSWLQVARLNTPVQGAGRYGEALALSGPTALVSQPLLNIDGGVPGVGGVHVYTRSDSGWSFETTLFASDAALMRRFGTRVALAADVAVIGAPHIGSGPVSHDGAAYVFRGSGASWVEEAKLQPALVHQLDDYGDAVALDGDRVAVGAYERPNAQGLVAGAVFLYERSGTAWTQTSELTASNGGASYGFGRAVALEGATLVVGSSGSGSVYTYDVSAPAPVVYCTAGTSASGCQALLSACGAPSATAPSGFDLTASSVEGQKDGLFFFGTNGRQANPWGSGTSFQCVTPPVARAGLLPGSGTSGLCDGALAQDFNALWCPTCPKPLSNPGAGAVVQAQLWYRDPFNTSNQTTSLSDAVEFSVAP